MPQISAGCRPGYFPPGMYVPLLQLSSQIAVPVDRPLYHLRKIRREKGIAEKIPFLLLPSPVDIDEIARSLENIKGNSQRKQQIKRPERKIGGNQRQNPVQRLKPGVKIFKYRQRQEIDEECRRENSSLPARPSLFHFCLFPARKTFRPRLSDGGSCCRATVPRRTSGKSSRPDRQRREDCRTDRKKAPAKSSTTQRPRRGTA